MGELDGPLAAGFEALETERVRWAVLRGDPGGSSDAADIDVLVHPDDVARLEAILAPVGFVRIATWRHGDHRFYIAYVEATDRWVKLDVVDRFAFRSGHELPPSTVAAALDRRVRQADHWRISPSDEFWGLLMHCLLDRGDVGEHADRLRILATPEPDGPIRAALGSEPLALAAVDAARSGDAAGMLALRPALQAALGRPTAARRLRRTLLRAADPVLKALGRNGVSVAIIGPDGAGKSTLVRSLPGRFPLQVRTHYVGLYGARGRRLRDTGIPGVALASQLALAWAAYGSAALERRRSRITVFDRYGYDALLGPPSSRAGIKRSVRRALLGSLAPRPDLVLVMDAPATRLHRRRSGDDLAVAERRRTAYRRLARELEPRVTTILVDSTASRPSVRRRATALIWQAVGERRTRRGRLAQRRPDNMTIDGDARGAHDGR